MKGRAPRVLVVDDETGIVTRLASLLRQLGCEPQTAQGGQAALDQLAHDPLPDLLIVDLAMPQLDGLALLRIIRQQARLTALPVVMVAARCKYVGEIEALGIEGWLSRPVTPDELHDLLLPWLVDAE